MIPLLFAAVIGFNHAFEADHVLAVGNIVNKRANFWHAVRDGLFWGLGHTSMIFAIGCVIIIGKTMVTDAPFDFFEVLVGVSLIILGVYRFRSGRLTKSHSTESVEPTTHKLAYSIGLIHGLAGSGAVILVAMSELQHTLDSVLYLIIFGIGSILGMMVVAGVINLPFSKKIKVTDKFQSSLLTLSSALCVGYGIWMVLRYFI